MCLIIQDTYLRRLRAEGFIIIVIITNMRKFGSQCFFPANRAIFGSLRNDCRVARLLAFCGACMKLQVPDDPVDFQLARLYPIRFEGLRIPGGAVAVATGSSAFVCAIEFCSRRCVDF